MKPKAKMLVAVVLGLAFASIGCAAKGACVTTGVAGGAVSCTDDSRHGACKILSGTLHEAVTCEGLGFRVTNENPTMGGITGV